jgi:hypothetical protein
MVLVKFVQQIQLMLEAIAFVIPIFTKTEIHVRHAIFHVLHAIMASVQVVQAVLILIFY